MGKPAIGVSLHPLMLLKKPFSNAAGLGLARREVSD
jgi:hypothetical protein